MKLAQILIALLVLIVGMTGLILFFGFFLALLAGIVGAGFILLVVGGIISVVEKISETKGK